MAARRSQVVVHLVAAHRSLVEGLAEEVVAPDLQVGTRSRLGRHPGQDFASVEPLALALASAQSLVQSLVEEQIHLLCQLLLLLQALPCSTE